jgi:hypothetical protein
MSKVLHGNNPRARKRNEEAVLRTAIRDLRTVAEQIAILMTRPGLSLKETARLNK